MKIIKISIIFIIVCFYAPIHADDSTFKEWLTDFKIYALQQNISETTYDTVMSNVVFLPKVIKYDRFQPEFYENTKTYISKRTSKQKIKQGLSLHSKNINFIDSIDNNFSVEKRRSKFFTNELITVLQLIELGTIDHKILYGSWAGAFGNFQFMPSTIHKYAIDYDKNDIIELKSIKDSFASAANYINKIGWKKNEPCFIKIKLTPNTPNELLNTSAKKIHSKNKFKDLKKYIANYKDVNIDDSFIAAIITPDKDIIPNSKNLEPAFIIFENYEKILQWNRSLRFALAVCTLKDKFENAL